MDTELKIKARTEGFEEATQKVEALAEAYEGFPVQVQIKGCNGCTFNIYPSQVQIKETGDNEE